LAVPVARVSAIALFKRFLKPGGFVFGEAEQQEWSA